MVRFRPFTFLAVVDPLRITARRHVIPGDRVLLGKKMLSGIFQHALQSELRQLRLVAPHIQAVVVGFV